ncbi:hypothetical protein [Miniphocaeibacter massiliensis]|uniref:hypothetical protein n=1 Tax=Miniphocaeibacter massiliensis TaxID=2041841 RepID=UPI000C1C0BEE|nr:hypothetical protein [Miniphocaeibacter massiliensis]
MERMLVAKLNNGMDSCMRVLSVLRNKRYSFNELKMTDENLTLYVDEEIYSDVHLFLSKLVDVKIQ